VIATAVRATVETLEDRRLLAADLPHISYEILDGQASEIGADPGVFLVSRTGATDQPLTVRVYPSGNSSYTAPDRDHTMSVRTASGTSPYIVGALTFPSGIASLELVITPLADLFTEGSERVELQITEASVGSPAYTFDTPLVRPSFMIADGAGAQSITLETTDPVGSENGDDPIEIVARRTGDLSQHTSLWLNHNYRDGFASEVDYLQLGSLYFEPGVTEKTIFIVPTSDDLVEGSEPLPLTANPVGLARLTNELVLTITDGPVVTPVVLTPVADAWVGNGTEAGQNFGSEMQLRIRDQSSGGRRDVYLRFDLSSVEIISQADLQIYGEWLGSDPGYGRFRAFVIPDAVWTESGVTYNTAPTGPLYGYSGTGMNSVNKGKRLLHFSMGTFLQKLKRLGHDDVTIHIFADLDPELNGGPVDAALDSRESATPPRLVIQTETSNGNVPVSHRSLRISEGGSGVVYTSPSTRDPDDSLNIMKIPGGDPDVNVVDPMIAYARGDGSTVRTTTFTATPDGDAINGSALFLISGRYGTGTFVRVYESDTGINVPPTDPNTLTMAVTADGFAQDGAGNIGGVASTLQVKSATTGAQETYLQVDLTSLPQADQIGTAMLRLYGSAGTPVSAGTFASQTMTNGEMATMGSTTSQTAEAPMSVSAFAAADTDWFWNEFNLNWETRPTPTGSAVVTKSVGAQDWYEFDIAPILRAKKAAGAKSAAIALRGANAGTTSAVFASDESGANRPQLVVTKVTSVDPPPPTTTVTLQAEDALLANGTAKSTQHAGYTGSGYADYAGNGSAAQWTVTRAAAGAATLSLRYANGGTTSRPLTVFVNNVAVGTLACAPTGGWATWSTVSLPATATLAAGTNTIRLVASTSAGGANADALTITSSSNGDPVTPPPPPPTDPASVTLQAEDALLSNGTARGTQHAGYAGGGYADYAGNGSAAQWTVTRAAAGAATLSLRYANGGATGRPLTIYVNGVRVGTVDCAPTGGWATWSSSSLAATLAAGTNVIRAVAGVATGANVDALTITSGTVTPPPPVQPSVTVQAESATMVGVTRQTTNGGYAGSGYADFGGAGSYVQLTVGRTAAGPTMVTLRYANGSAGDRPLSVSVNGVVAHGSLAMTGTGSWTTWRELTLSLDLTAGSNVIRLTSMTANGVNLDAITVG
jgi:hypothetical protein